MAQRQLAAKIQRAVAAQIRAGDDAMNDEQLQALQKLTERYCVIYQTLCNPPAVKVSRSVA
jgi:hypothetical protein